MQHTYWPSEWLMPEQPADPELNAWIVALRTQLAAGAFAAARPIDVGYGTAAWPAERTLRIMLADLDHYDDLSPAQRLDPLTANRRLALLDDFRHLRELVG
jgi:hypothetical protein